MGLAGMLVVWSITAGAQSVRPPTDQTVPSAPPPRATPVADTPPAAGQPKVISPADARPGAIKAPSTGVKKPDEPPTTIDAGESELDPKAGVHIFRKNVVVHSPQFDLTTDGTLEVHIKPQKDKPASAPPAPANPGADPKAPAPKAGDPKAGAPQTPVADAGKAKAGGEGTSSQIDIDWAEARGRLVNVQKRGADGRLKVGIAKHIIFDSKTGEITLKEWPQVQDGPNLIIATEESTVMVIDQNNHFRSYGGKTTTKLMPANDPNKGK